MTTLSTSHASLAAAKSATGHGRLQKRGGSISSLAQSYHAHAPSASTTTLQERGSLDNLSASSAKLHSSHSQRLKPYLRKMSMKENDGLDLSLTTAENVEKVTGVDMSEHLGASRSAADVSFYSASRRASAHGRKASVASLGSLGSGQFKPSQPFVHPMRQNPRPYTPPSQRAQSPVYVEEDAAEGADTVSNDFSQRQAEYEQQHRSRRSTSISSGTQVLPIVPIVSTTSHTTDCFGPAANASMTNLSVRSGKSVNNKSRSRGNTSRSFDLNASPSSRTSFDKAFSLLAPKTSEPEDPATRAASIRAARRAFEKKEADKAERLEKEQKKREARELQRRRSRSDTSHDTRQGGNCSEPHDSPMEEEKVLEDGYMSSSAALAAAQGGPDDGEAAKQPPQLSKTKVARSGWYRFATWTRTRLLNCG